jgi:cell division protein FtsW
MDLASGTLASAKHGAVAHWKVSVTGERHGQGAGPRVLVVS